MIRRIPLHNPEVGRRTTARGHIYRRPVVGGAGMPGRVGLLDRITPGTHPGIAVAPIRSGRGGLDLAPLSVQQADAHITDPGLFRSVHFTLELVRTLKTLYPEKIYQGSSSLTLMFGTDGLARYLRGELSFSDLLAEVRADEEAFLRKRRPYLLY